jgi:hypothetical protein
MTCATPQSLRRRMRQPRPFLESALVGPAILAIVVSCSNAGEPGMGLPWPEDSLNSLVIRTDFTDDGAWAAVRSAIETPVSVSVNGVAVGEFKPFVQLVNDRRFDGLTVDQLLALADDPTHIFAFLVDREALTDPDQPILVVDLAGEPGRTFRVIPSAMWDVQNNLAIGNVDWDDYESATDQRGIYRDVSE